MRDASKIKNTYAVKCFFGWGFKCIIDLSRRLLYPALFWVVSTFPDNHHGVFPWNFPETTAFYRVLKIVNFNNTRKLTKTKLELC